MAMSFLLLAAATLAAIPTAGGASPPEQGVAAVCEGDFSLEQIAGLSGQEVQRRLVCANRDLAARMAPLLPKKINDESTIERVSVEGTQFTFHIHFSIAGGEVAPWVVQATNDFFQDVHCKVGMFRETVVAGGSYRYLWIDKAGVTFMETRLTRC